MFGRSITSVLGCDWKVYAALALGVIGLWNLK
jgi:hypothetical protein